VDVGNVVAVVGTVERVAGDAVEDVVSVVEDAAGDVAGAVGSVAVDAVVARAVEDAVGDVENVVGDAEVVGIAETVVDEIVCGSEASSGIVGVGFEDAGVAVGVGCVGVVAVVAVVEVVVIAADFVRDIARRELDPLQSLACWAPSLRVLAANAVVDDSHAI